MEFEWDEAKNRLNIEKHGIDFSDAVAIFGASLSSMRMIASTTARSANEQPEPWPMALLFWWCLRGAAPRFG
jgi:uncharacterized DUF497 family protein